MRRPGKAPPCRFDDPVTAAPTPSTPGMSIRTRKPTVGSNCARRHRAAQRPCAGVGGHPGRHRACDSGAADSKESAKRSRCRPLGRAACQCLLRPCPGAAKLEKASVLIGAVAFIHRFGSSLNTHAHLQVCCIHGVFVQLADGQALDLLEPAIRGRRDALHCRIALRSAADAQPERRLPRKLSGWTRLNAGLQISKLLARNQSSTRASQQLGQELKNLASPTPGTQADDVD